MSGLLGLVGSHPTLFILQIKFRVYPNKLCVVTKVTLRLSTCHQDNRLTAAAEDRFRISRMAPVKKQSVCSFLASFLNI